MRNAWFAYIIPNGILPTKKTRMKKTQTIFKAYGLYRQRTKQQIIISVAFSATTNRNYTPRTVLTFNGPPSHSIPLRVFFRCLPPPCFHSISMHTFEYCQWKRRVLPWIQRFLFTIGNAHFSHLRIFNQRVPNYKCTQLLLLRFFSVSYSVKLFSCSTHFFLDSSESNSNKCWVNRTTVDL